LGADIAITSVLLAAALSRFPRAEIYFAGPAKNYELFRAAPRIRHMPAPYVREGSLTERFSVLPALQNALSGPDAIVLDPDSRLTQLGLLPVCAEESYYFFESRSYGGYGNESLSTLTREWVRRTFEVEGMRPFLATGIQADPEDITVSLGIGENPAKRIADPFERELISLFSTAGRRVLVDRGGSQEESGRVDAAVKGIARVRTFTGPFSAFAAAIANSSFYCGYDSAGQHAAAASGVPLATIFAGAPCSRFVDRWKPEGQAESFLIPADGLSPRDILNRIRQML
jgi:ADP-heptose:LPS heptosyltransferase